MKKRSVSDQMIQKIFLAFFFPSLTSSVALSVISMTDLAVAGFAVGGNGLAAVSFSMPVILLVNILASFLGMGASIKLSHYLGREETDNCNIIFTLSLLLSALIGLVIAVGGSLCVDTLVNLCGAREAAVHEQTRAYMLPILVVFPMMLLSQTGNVILRNDSRPRLAMFIVLGCGVLNIALDVVFSLLLDWGMAGIACATAIAETVSALCVLYNLLLKKTSFHLVRVSVGKQYRQLAAQSFSAGSSVALIFLLQMVLTTFINYILMWCGGAVGVAIYAVVKYLINFIYALFDGVTGAMQPMLGIYYGEGQTENIRRTCRIAFSWIMLMALCIMAVMEIATPLLCRIFGAGSADLFEEAKTAIRIQAVFVPTAASIAFLNAYYRNVSLNHLSLMLTLFNNSIFPILSVLVCVFLLHRSYTGVFWGLVISDYLTVLLWLMIVSAERKKTGRSGVLLLGQNEGDDDTRILLWKTYYLSRDALKQTALDVEAATEELPPKKAFYISLCTEEMLVNSNMLGDRSLTRNFAEIRLTRHEGCIRLCICDTLTGFDPTAVRTESMEAAAQEEDINLLGIEMVKRFAKDYSYRRTIGMNIFSIDL